MTDANVTNPDAWCTSAGPVVVAAAPGRRIGLAYDQWSAMTGGVLCVDARSARRLASALLIAADVADEAASTDGDT